MPTLRPYQQEDVDFLVKIDCAGIFSEQRTGKTPTAIEVAKRKTTQADKILILCPPSAIPVWIREWKLWFPEGHIVAAFGDRQKKLKRINEWQQTLVIAYDSLKATKTRKGFIDEIKTKAKGNLKMVIIDEAHRIQTRSAAVTSAVYEFIRTKYRIAISGTPATNQPYQIFSILRWLYPKVFTSYWAYIAEFYNSEKQLNHATNVSYTTIGAFQNQQKKEEHAKILQKISVQRKRSEVMPWLPEKEIPQRILLEPTTTQKKAVDHLNKYFEVGNIEVEGILSRLLRERQICADPKLLGMDGRSPKSDYIIEYAKDYPERSIIVFSKFTSYLKLLHQQIKRETNITCELFIGDTTINQRNRITEDFQAGKIRILLANIDAAKEALTLDRAETAIFADKYPPVGSIQQAEDRFVATTPEKANKQHTIIELCIQRTYDERLYEMLQNNAEQIDIVNDYKKYLKGE